MTNQATIRVLCVDDHELLAEGLMTRLSLERDMVCVGRLSSADQLVEEVKRTSANVVLLDMQMPGADPLGRLAELHQQRPDVTVIILTAHVRDAYIDLAMDRGAAGYFSKLDSPATIFAGIREAVRGTPAFGEGVRERLQSDRTGESASVGSKLRTLSPRETEVLRLIGLGMARADIARRLFRSIKTIDAHHTAIMRKLDIHDRAEVTRFAIREGLVEA